MHWYTTDGVPRYDAGLREGREERLLPSVTEIDKIIAKPGLEIWKTNQAIESALTYPVGEMSSDEIIKAVRHEASRRARDTARFGTAVHRIVQYELSRGGAFYHGQRADVVATAQAAIDWVNAEFPEPRTIYGERVLTSMYGYAGKADLIIVCRDRIAIVDIKTQDVPEVIGKRGKPLKPKVTFRDSFARQLAALSKALSMIAIYDWLLPIECWNVVTSRIPPHRAYAKRWTEDELVEGWRQFSHALELFKSINRLDV